MKSSRLDFTAEQVANSALAALIAEHSLPLPPKGALTAAQFAAKIGRSPHTAKAILEKSKLNSGSFRASNGKAATFYY